MYQRFLRADSLHRRLVETHQLLFLPLGVFDLVLNVGKMVQVLLISVDLGPQLELFPLKPFHNLQLALQGLVELAQMLHLSALLVLGNASFSDGREQRRDRAFVDLRAAHQGRAAYAASALGLALQLHLPDYSLGQIDEYTHLAYHVNIRSPQVVDHDLAAVASVIIRNLPAIFLARIQSGQ